MQEDIHKIADHFELDNQIPKLQEEMAELNIAITKFKTEGVTNETLTNFIEEIVDVEIMIDQVKYLLMKNGNITESLFEIQNDYKIRRTIERYKIGGSENE